MRSVISKSLSAGAVVLLAIAVVGCCHMSGKQKGMSCCGPGAKCSAPKTAAPAAAQPQGQGVQQ